MGRTYEITVDGEWIEPIVKGYRVACCDCGLVHVMNFRLVGKKRKRMQYQLFRDERATAMIRRHSKNKKK